MQVKELTMSSDVFFCERLSCVLTEETCSKRWTLAKSTASYLSCKGCQVGELNTEMLPALKLLGKSNGK
jgi:hypothetical protein